MCVLIPTIQLCHCILKFIAGGPIERPADTLEPLQAVFHDSKLLKEGGGKGKVGRYKGIYMFVRASMLVDIVFIIRY